ncbi:MAG TPA: PAS domain S-box protein [Nitrospirae bacterium]|nr:PAS domain S-box protein [Nitrospirota bacterium]
MADNILTTAAKRGLDTQEINKNLTEKAFRLRCLAYLSNVKADLLTETIFSMRKSKSALSAEIRQRKLIEEKLRKSHDLYRQMFTNNSAVKTLIDPRTGDIVDANPSACKFYGYTRQELTSMKAWDISVLQEEECRREMAMAEAETCTYFCFQNVTKSGEIREVEVYSSPINTGGDNLIHSIIHDITDRKRAEETANEHKEKLMTLINSSPDSIFFKDGKGRWQIVNDAGLDLFKLSGVDYVGKKDSELAHLADSIYSDSLGMCEGTDEETWQEGRQTRCEEVVPSPGGPSTVLDVIKVPLFNKDGSRKAIVIIGRDITESRKDRERLEESEEWFRVITASANDAIVVIDDEDKITYWNQAAERVYGHTSEEAVGQTLHDLVIPDSIRERYIQWYENFKNSGEQFYPGQTVVRRGVRKNGEEFPMELSVATVKIRGKFYAVGFVRDATERLKIQANLEKSLSVHHATLESTADGMLVVDHEGKVVSFNRKFLLMWRIPHALAQSGNDIKLVEFVLDQLKKPDDFTARIKELYSKPEEESFDLLEFKDDRIFERYSTSQKIDGQSVGRVWSFRDVTERKKMENMLHETLLEMNTILDSLEVGITFVRSEKINWVNQKMLDMFGYSRNEVDGEPVEIFHTSSGSFTQLKDEALPVITSGKIHLDERLMKRKDGSSFWCRLIGKAIDPDERDKGSIWIVEDITERKRVAEKLRLDAAVLENTTEGVIITDANCVILSVNPAFVRITGFRAKEVIGAKPSVLSSGRHDKKFYEDVWSELLAKGEWEGVFWNKRKNGEVYPHEATITAIKDEQGNTTQYASIFRDVTDRKRQEEQIKYLAFHDPLTDLPNRKLFFDRIEVELARAKREKEKLSIMFVDLDNFKKINDSMGHDVGDKLLKKMAGRLKKCIRESDTVSRLGGDEFILLLPNISDKAGVKKIAKKILAEAKAPILIGSHKISITASIGLSMYPKDGDGPDTLVKKADDAMYAVKQSGRNNYKFC